MLKKLKSRLFKTPQKPDQVRGPSGKEWIALALLFLDDQIVFFKRMQARYGDIYWLRILNYPYFVVHDPKLIETILIHHADALEKDQVTRALRDMLGLGLLTNEGEPWKVQRRLASPSLRPKQIRAYASDMLRFTNQHIQNWTDEKTIDLSSEMMSLTLKIVLKTILGIEEFGNSRKAGEALGTVMESFFKENNSAWSLVPKKIPLAHRREFKKAVHILDEIIYALIEKRKSKNTQGDDLLNRFILAKDEHGHAMSDQQLRDETMTMFLAGHETTSLSMTYLFTLLAENPLEEMRVLEEIGALGKKEIGLEDIPKLKYLEAAAKEALRIFPPAWLIGRRVISDFKAGGVLFEKDQEILFPQSSIHHDMRFFENPHAFKPSRWLDGSLDENPKFAYFPFGGGSRVCLGNHFAMMEIILVVSTILQKYQLRKVDTSPMVMLPAITLRTKEPIKMVLHARPE